MDEAPPAPPLATSARRRRLAVTALVIVLAGALGVATGILPARPASAVTDLCRDVAGERGLVFRGAYGTTPFAFNPMSAVMLRNMGNGAAVGDPFGDGALSVYLLGQIGHPNRLFRNQLGSTGKATFVDVTEEAGLANKGGSRVAAFADLDNDADADLVVMNDWDGKEAGFPSRIHRNNADGTFSDATPGSGFAPVGYLVGGLSLADFNRDGLLDLYVSYWTMELGGDPGREMTVEGQFPGQNRLYQNLGGLRFRDVTVDAGLGQFSADSFSSVFADFNGDAWPDLYVAVDHRADLFYENLGGTFRNAAKAHGIDHVGNDMGIAAADLQNDGLIDLYATNISDPNLKFGNSQGNTLLVARRDPDGSVTYADEAARMGVLDTGWGWGTAFTDLNLDGHLDLYAVQGMQEFIAQQSPELRNQRARLFLGEGGAFELATGNGCDVEGDQRSVVPLDYDRDGAPDLLITNMAYSVTLLENQTDGRHWLTVDLSAAGAQAAGARVTVTAGDSSTTQVALYGGSYLAGMPLELYFGLGDAASADRVLVVWADGRAIDLGSIEADRRLRVTPAGIEP